jgi:hypothetical protein
MHILYSLVNLVDMDGCTSAALIAQRLTSGLLM